MKTLIENYTSFPGDHCGSVAMRGLLKHYCDLELPEAAVFGLGSGVACVYMEAPGMESGVALFGRTVSLETDLGLNLQIDYREQMDEDDDNAWQVAREEVLAGRPTMLSGDILYLDYREFKVHFPGHRFVLVGFDDDIEKAFIADRIKPEPEACSYDALRMSRNPKQALSTNNLWGRFHGTEVGRSLVDATAAAIDRSVKTMLGSAPEPDGESPFAGADVQVVSGVEGIEHFARQLPGWAKRDDVLAVAGFNAACIEKFGNGGGNFRRLYAGFLDWAHALDPVLASAQAGDLARKSADSWTAASTCLYRVAEEGPLPTLFEEAAQHIDTVATTERQLFTELAG